MQKDFTKENVISLIEEKTGKIIDIKYDENINVTTFSYNTTSRDITDTLLMDYVINTDNSTYCIHQLSDFSNILIDELKIPLIKS